MEATECHKDSQMGRLIVEASSSQDGPAFVFLAGVRNGIIHVDGDDVMARNHRQAQHARLLNWPYLLGGCTLLGTLRGQR